MISIEKLSDVSNLRSIARLLSKMDDSNGTGCWEWQGSFLSGGYGQFYYGVVDGKEKSGKAHRAAWVLLKGPVPEGMNVLHKCHNRRCCNPNHLYIGTHMDNMKDRDRVGRTSRGAHRYNFKRDDALAARANELREKGLRVADICRELDIGLTTYYRIARAGSINKTANRAARSANLRAAMALRV